MLLLTLFRPNLYINIYHKYVENLLFQYKVI